MHIRPKLDNSFRVRYLTLAVASVFVLILTFLISNINLSFDLKLSIFISAILIYLVFIFFTYRFENKEISTNPSDENIFNVEIEEKLLILEEAGEFFGASLKSGDMFRLISGRIGELIPFSNCSLFLINQEKTTLSVAFSSGENSKYLKNVVIKTSEGLAGKTYVSGNSQIDNKSLCDLTIFPTEFTSDIQGSIASPLSRNGEVFAVIQLFGNSTVKFDKNTLVLLEAICSRIVPLLSSSMAFEKSLSNALTDNLTNLPNERAFYLVLENQIAEAQRLSEKRQLTVLVMDIRNFKEVNERYGHSTGDKILTFASEHIKTQLRQMDFLARSSNDDFFAVLPTASEKITFEIIKRIERTFVLNPYKITFEENIHLQIGFGAATFLQDGETAQELLNTALVKKKQSKSNNKDNQVLFFPKEFIN